MCGGGSAARASARQSEKQFAYQQQQQKLAEQREAERQARITAGANQINQQFDSFSPQFYDKIRDSYYKDYALPQITQQEQRDTQKARFGLARGGILNSSAAAREFGDIAQVYGDTRLNAYTRGQEMAESRRNDVETNRRQALTALYSSEDPEIAIQGAQRATQSLSSAPALQPITDLLATASNWAARDYMNSQYNTGSPGIFSPFFGKSTGGSAGGSGTAKVVNG